MKKLLLVGAALALPSCAALPAISAVSSAASVVSGISSAGDKVVMEGTRALVLAEYAYNSAATAVNATGQACLDAPSLPCPISAEDAGKIRELNAKAWSILAKAKNAKTDAEKAVAARDVFAIISTIDDLRK